MITVEVFPVEPDRWISVAHARSAPADPRTYFSAETRNAAGVEHEVQETIRAELRSAEPFELIDDLGAASSPRMAPEQLRRLDVTWGEDGPTRRRPSRVDRLLRRHPPENTGCPACGHDWDAFDRRMGSCGTCAREMERGLPDAATVRCPLAPFDTPAQT